MWSLASSCHAANISMGLSGGCAMNDKPDVSMLCHFESLWIVCFKCATNWASPHSNAIYPTITYYINNDGNEWVWTIFGFCQEHLNNTSENSCKQIYSFVKMYAIWLKAAGVFNGKCFMQWRNKIENENYKKTHTWRKCALNQHEDRSECVKVGW